jgi:hypothetical protein
MSNASVRCVPLKRADREDGQRRDGAAQAGADAVVPVARVKEADEAEGVSGDLLRHFQGRSSGIERTGDPAGRSRGSSAPCPAAAPPSPNGRDRR